MKKKYIWLLAALILVASFVSWLGVGPYASGSAVADLKDELRKIHGKPYTGRPVENGTEDMEFSITPATFFATNYNLRQEMGWDYRYNCDVIYTLRQGDEIVSHRTVSYVGVDPMGHGEEYDRAYLVQE